ncbi:hypothetical protein [Meiothermus ruber]|uniref:Amino acid transporter n=1 Tax=Meiothermus ruber (strain ATCC 35948 / DSM 1279 / VKM B-1258 / 21) TaxID=504728 RepID=D3PQR6_MEIRD|nr:hypothetical protein [Meiothermus ruber]ADD27799.1 hypothetical protein Mrub_1035 [Meiothermus ruber DSM 1279]AGK04266.1 hypothetical protein K649_04820 [Meiothermus ruber DSM 1279]MCL6529977.1 APC family permease [Meiothermus ruber]
MSVKQHPARPISSRLQHWLLEGAPKPSEGYYKQPTAAHSSHPWWRVMCLTGVDYFSTLGYQPGIAALAAGALSPIATLVLVSLTLFGALPMYRRVAGESPHGDGSISMLERLLKGWTGKFVVLTLIGFVATGFVITITLSAADAAKHIVENPLAPDWLNSQIGLTLLLVGLLGAVFLRGFKEAIGIAVVLVVVYIGLNLVVIGQGISLIAQNPGLLAEWTGRIALDYATPAAVVVAALVVFPKLALGLSGFETGVVVMPLVRGWPGDSPQHPVGRIANSRKLLTTAALIMSVMLLSSSLVTTLLIPPSEFWPETTAQRELRGQARTIDVPLGNGDVYTYHVPERTGSFTERIQLEGKQGTIHLEVTVTPTPGGRLVQVTKEGGAANGRALAFLAHQNLGEWFGSLYDLSTILILWFAGASAMAGLLNITPRYLPRYGMAPDWARAVRPLVLIFTGVCVLVTLIFRADVNAQAGAYATGVLALMTSAAFAVMLSALAKRQLWAALGFGLVTAIFIYTATVTVLADLDGLVIAAFFIAAIVVVSLISRVFRSTELRAERVQADLEAQAIIRRLALGEIRLVANHRDSGSPFEYTQKQERMHRRTHLPNRDPVAFLEVSVPDASDFSDTLYVHGVEVGEHQVLRVQGTSIPNAIAALLLYIRDTTGKLPHVYFEWSERPLLRSALDFILYGEGDVPSLTHEVLRKAEPDPKRRPVVHVGG